MPVLSSNPGLDNVKIFLSHYAIMLPCINVQQYKVLIKYIHDMVIRLFIILKKWWQNQIPYAAFLMGDLDAAKGDLQICPVSEVLVVGVGVSRQLQNKWRSIYFEMSVTLIPKIAHSALTTLKTDRLSLSTPDLQKYLLQKSISSVTIYCGILLSGSEKPHGKSQCYTC